MRLLLLGGTGEARALAAALLPRGIEVVSSLAGRVTNPALPVGEVRIGGFGGVDGLVEHLGREAIDAVVDATHPFAATITRNAAAAAHLTGVPLLVLRRPGWSDPDGSWTRVPDIEAAAALAAAAPPGTVFLTTGRRDLAAFAADAGHAYLARAVDPPETAMPPHTTVLLARGPYRVDDETALLHEHAVSLLITKDSGGAMTAAKLSAARALGVPVVVVDRPPLPPGVEAVDTVDAAARWVLSLDSAGG
ncbi:cobalt-precorrin-6A reductase [Jatrophihabitans sp.]|uniref:cobalt-precorrin-6A reductase n=1 Tax=Jatrophihabitans sp. TaxID=1932789 RepID=UPI0030C76E91|nr:cobalt-precorrin-6A reductase [Jatrophihabitans sp.]